MLVAEKLAGGVKGCMGFVLDEETGYYTPNTVLNFDIRTLSNESVENRCYLPEKEKRG